MFKESFYVLLFRGVELLVALLVGIIINRHLGPEGRGALASLLVVNEMSLIIFSFGTDICIYYYLDKCKSIFKESEVIASAIVMYVIWGIVAVVLVVSVPWIKTSFLKLDLIYTVVFSTLIFFGIFNKLLYVLNQIKGTILNLCYTQIISSVFYFMLIVLFHFYRITIEYIILFMSFQALLRLIIYSYNLKNVIEFRKKFISRSFIKELIKSGVRVYPAAIATYCYVKIDQMLLFNMSGPIETGLYNVAVTLATLVMVIPQSVQVVMYNRIMKIEMRNESEFTLLTTKYTFWMILVISIVFIVIAKPLVYVYGGKDFLAAAGMLRTIVFGVSLFAISNLLSPLWVKRGYFLVGGLTSVVLMIINIFLNIILIPIYGGMGSCYATNLTYIVGVITSMLIFYKITGDNPLIIFSISKKDCRNMRNIIHKKGA